MIDTQHKAEIQPSLIWHGLLDCDRETLSIFIAMFEDSKGLSLLADKLLNIKDKIKKAYNKSMRQQTLLAFRKNYKDSFSKRVEKTAHSLAQSSLSDDALRCALWEHLLTAFNLENEVSLCPRDLTRVCDDMANVICEKVAWQKQKRNLDFADRLNSFKPNRDATISFEQAIEYLIENITKELLDQGQAFSPNLQKRLSSLDNQIMRESGVDNLTQNAIRKNLFASGGLLGLMGGVEVAGFSAYILAAKASAIIPLVSAKGLVSLLFIVSHPFFVIPAIIATGAITNRSLEKSIKLSFATIISALLVMRGMAKKHDYVGSTLFLNDYSDLLRIVSASKLLTNKTCEKADMANLILPDIKIEPPNLCGREKMLLVSPTEVKNDNGKVILKIQRTCTDTLDSLAIGGLTFGDFIYDVAAIDSRVIEAIDFARKADISDIFEFSIFAESLDGLAEASLTGHYANLMGYTAERLVASQLIKEGHIVEIPDSASQPGYDLLVDGLEFQVKCVAPESFDLLGEHFDKYPTTPVFVNSEMAEIIDARMPEWAGLVFYVGGFTHEKANGLLTQALEAGQQLNNYDVLSSVALVSIIRNTINWRKGVQSLQTATFNVALDSVSKGGMALAGGVAGSGIGMLLFGPAGAYIFGGLSSIFGATKGDIITNQIDKILAPEREKRFKELGDILLTKCNLELARKIEIMDVKISRLSDSGVSAYVKHRFMWEMAFFKIAINRHEFLIKDNRISGNKKLFKSLKYASESTVHPYCLQKEYQQIASCLGEKLDRIDKFGSLIKRAVKQNA